MPKLHTVALAALLALAALPAAAQAGVVDYSSINVLDYVASAGETNDLAITREADRIVYEERGGVIITATAAAIADCDGEGTSRVACKIDHGLVPVFSAGAALGDMDDHAVAGPLGGIDVSFRGQAGADQLDAANATAQAELTGGLGNDRLVGGHGVNRLGDYPNEPGDDVLVGGPAGSQTSFSMSQAADGADVLQGGAGLDIAEYDSRTNAVHVSADGVADDGEPGEGDNVSPAVESIQGGPGPDVLVASLLVDAQLSGYGGNDQLIGGPGDDTLFGGVGVDALVGNGGDDTAVTGDGGVLSIGGGTVDSGADSFAGGAGFDTQDYSARLAPVSVTLDDLANDGEAGESDDIRSDVEQLIGGHGPDVLTGNAAAQRIVGGPGDDTIDPGAGSDEVRAGDGDDSVKAQDATADTIACGLGADTLAGDFNDVLDGCEAAALTSRPVAKKPKVKLGGLPSKPRWHHLKTGLKLRLTANEPVSYLVELQGAATSAHIARKPSYNLTLVRKTIKRAGKTAKVTLKPKSTLLGARRKLVVRLRITATNAAGTTTVVTKTLKVHR